LKTQKNLIKKYVAMFVAVILLFNVAVGDFSVIGYAEKIDDSQITESILPGWIWYPARDGYCNWSGLAPVDSAEYTTFNVLSFDGYCYPGPNAGSLVGSLGMIDADANKFVRVRYRTSETGGTGQILANGGAFQETVFAWNGDGEWHDIIVDLSGYANWYGEIDWFRIDYMDNLAWGSIDIEYVAFFETAMDAYEWTEDMNVEEEDNFVVHEGNWIWNCAEHSWCYENSLDCEVSSSGHYVTFSKTGVDPYVYPCEDFPGELSETVLGAINADTHKYFLMNYRITSADPGAYGTIVANSGRFEFDMQGYVQDGMWHTVIVDLSPVSAWKGIVDWVRFDLFNDNISDASIDLAYVGFFESEQDAEDWAEQNAVNEEETEDGFIYTTESDEVTIIGYFGTETMVKIPSKIDGMTVKHIGKDAFANCSDLISVVTPTSVTSIGASAFVECNAFTDIYFLGSEAEWNEITVSPDGNELLSEISVHFDCSIALDGESSLKIDTDKGFVTGAVIGTTVSDIIGQFASSYEVGAADAEGNTLEADAVIGTGCKVQQVIDGVVFEELTTVITGDTDGDGAVTVADAQIGYSHLLGIDIVSGAYAEAAKANGGNTMSILDVMAILNMI